MTDEILNTIIGALIALSSVFVTNIISIFQDNRKRKWILNDKKRRYALQIIEKRVKQIERIIESFSRVFHRREKMFLEWASGSYSSKEIINNHEEEMKKLMEEYDDAFIKPMIYSINDQEIYDLWEKAKNTSRELSNITQEIYQNKKNDTPIDFESIRRRTKKVKKDFNVIISSLYSRLDLIKMETFEKYK